MNKARNKHLIIFYVLIFLISFNDIHTLAWSNGSKYANDNYNYDYSLHYGTHEWISHKAMEILLDYDYYKWEWLKDREIIYLCGTEAPDNYNLEMTLDGEIIKGFGDQFNHHVYFYENGSVKYGEDIAAIRAQNCYEMAEIRLREKKFEQAAFYFGAMTHYISDCSMYAHVAQSNVTPHDVDFDQWHALLETLVNGRTNNSYEREEFFNYTAQVPRKDVVYNITLELGWDTYKDPNPSEPIVRDALWLHNNFFSDWATTYDERLSETNQTRILYYNRIEENLNKAIEGCVAAINYSSTTQTIHATQDAHVYSRYPSNNYGDETRMYLGNWNDGSQTFQDEVYIYFNITERPLSWQKVELCLYITDFTAGTTLDFTICSIMNNWDESLITWNNKPAHGPTLLDFKITKNGIKKIDITSLLSGDSFSICLYADINQWETIRIRSTEYSSLSSRPKLVFTYEDIDETLPNIIVNSPAANQIFGTEAPIFDITVSDPTLNSTWYTIDGGLINFTFMGSSDTINQSAWNARPDGSVTICFYANDSYSNLAAKEVTVKKDTIAPRISLFSPTSNQLCGVNAPSFNVQIQESNLLEKGYSLNGGQNITFTTQTELDQTEWNKNGNGTVLIKFYAKDKTGRLNISEVSVRKDAYVPELTIHSPFENEIFGITPPNFNISITEEDLDSTWYAIESIAVNFYITEFNGSIDQDAWESLPEGEIPITFYAQDAAGNLGTNIVIIIKSLPSRSTDNLPLIISIITTTSILGTVGVSGIVLVKYRQKIPNLRKHSKNLIEKIKKLFRRNIP